MAYLETLAGLYFAATIAMIDTGNFRSTLIFKALPSPLALILIADGLARAGIIAGTGAPVPLIN